VTCVSFSGTTSNADAMDALHETSSDQDPSAYMHSDVCHVLRDAISRDNAPEAAKQSGIP
jgi:hypothetical protein